MIPVTPTEMSREDESVSPDEEYAFTKGDKFVRAFDTLLDPFELRYMGSLTLEGGLPPRVMLDLVYDWPQGFIYLADEMCAAFCAFSGWEPHLP